MEHKTIDDKGLTVSYVVFDNEDFNELCNRDKRFKKILKDYDGEVAILELDGKPMLLPHIPELIKKINFMWDFAVFGFRGNTQSEKAIISELNKCMTGKTYSASKLANVMKYERRNKQTEKN